jgi:hypothetical protein
MKELTPSPERKGKLILIYGETGVGKTVSSLQTLPEPILWIFTEPRDPYSPIEATGKEVRLEKILVPESFDDLTEFFEEEVKKDKLPYNSLLFDSLSYYMNVSLSLSVEDETFEAKVFKGKRYLVDMTRKDEAAFGALSSLMKRICRYLGLIAQKGVNVIATALLQENPKWNRDLAAAPAFIGRDFPVNFPSYFDSIGLVERRLDQNGNAIYPPLVRFEGEGFVCKWSGKRPPKLSGPLDFSKILKY